MKKKAIIIFLFLIFCLKVQAAESDLQISEIMYDVSGVDSGHEWLEIFNTGSDLVVASSTWRFFDSSNHAINLYQGSSTIGVNDYFILADNAENFLIDYPDYQGTLFDTVMSLPNSSSTMSLSFDGGQTQSIQTFYDSSWGANGNGYSLEKLNDNWQEACLLEGSPGQANQECIVEDPPEGEEPVINHWAQIVISEFLPNPQGSDDSEWIELYNLGPEVVDISGFILGDDSSRRFTLDSDSNLDLVMSPNSYLVVYKNVSGISLNNSGTDSVRLYNPDNILQEKVEYSGPALEDRSYARSDNGFVWTKMPTPGSDNQIVENQAPIAQISASGDFKVSQKILFSGEYSSDPENEDLDYHWEFGDGESSTRSSIKHAYNTAGSFTVTLVVTDSEGAYDSASYQLTIEPDIQPDESNKKSDQADTKSDIVIPVVPENLAEDDLIISEFLPNPKGSDDSEWIELYNASSKNIDLSFWQLDDQEGGSKPYQFSSTTIAANSFLVVSRSESKITLNNSSDQVRLIRPDGKVWQTVNYEKVPEDKSYSWDMENSEWFVSDPSPEAFNIKKEEAQVVYLVSEINSLEKNQEILTQGVVLNSPDKNTKSIYLADFDGQNINFDNLAEIYNYYKTWPAISKGDLVTVAGQVSKLDDLPRIKIKSDQDIWSNDQNIKIGKPDIIGPDEVDGDFVGNFLSVKGVVVKKSGKNIYLASDVSSDPTVRVYASFSLADLDIKKRSEVLASGILSETDTSFKLVPLSIDDLMVSQEVLGEKIVSENQEIEISSSTNQAVIENRGEGIKNILIFLVVGVFILGLIFFIKKKRASGLTERSQI